MVRFRAKLGDCLDVMRDIPDNSFHSVVTDPPYGLSFMGKHWDHGVPGKIFWEEILRVSKPGSHLLAFGGTRTHHRLMVAIENAGWEIRDTLMWIYSSGFPKSVNISKGIDKAAGAEREVVGSYKATGTARTLTGGNYGGGGRNVKEREEIFQTAPATDAAKQWDGWGNNLKPAWEPIVLARKPLSEKTIVENILRWGTGGLNIEACRVEITDNANLARNNKPGDNGWKNSSGGPNNAALNGTTGRWPANFLHDGSKEVLEMFPNSGKGNGGEPYSYAGREYDNKNTSMFNGDKPQAPSNFNDSGSAARFFYCSKTSKKDREEGNTHNTVKPTNLMKYLCRLVTPPNGIVFDPFMGSGSTGKGALLEGFRFYGIDKEQEYVEIARKRLKNAEANS